ncbi:MAG: TlpA family protein disulfide reductase [Methanobacteriota archaeon]|nr:MAG: TlpA family protein disulfide reductase [Euryarchaeota archaeon]
MKYLVVIPLAFLILASMGSTAQGSYQINLSYLDLDGNQVSFSTYQGKWLFVEVFRHDCHFCIQQHPDLEQLYELRASKPEYNLTMLSLAVPQDTVEEIQSFMVDHPIKWEVGRDVQGAFSTKYNVQGTPTMILFDTNGYPATSWRGLTPLSDLITGIDTYISGENTERISDLNKVGNPSGSGSSLLGDFFGNPIVQAGFIASLLIFIYFKMTDSSPPPEDTPIKKETK